VIIFTQNERFLETQCYRFVVDVVKTHESKQQQQQQQNENEWAPALSLCACVVELRCKCVQSLAVFFQVGTVKNDMEMITLNTKRELWFQGNNMYLT
jgi:hypothetical protein